MAGALFAYAATMGIECPKPPGSLADAAAEDPGASGDVLPSPGAILRSRTAAVVAVTRCTIPPIPSWFHQNMHDVLLIAYSRRALHTAPHTHTHAHNVSYHNMSYTTRPCENIAGAFKTYSFILIKTKCNRPLTLLPVRLALLQSGVSIGRFPRQYRADFAAKSLAVRGFPRDASRSTSLVLICMLRLSSPLRCCCCSRLSCSC